MAENKAIPQGYMTVGEMAKKMDVTVRTLQYYDKIQLLSPSAESEGGRRLYTNKEMVRLHQILSLKHLGFSLDDIKNRLTALDTPTDVARALTEQAGAVHDKIEALTCLLKEIETLKAEVLKMQTVDFKKYADIIINLQMENDFYWLIKHFDDTLLDHIRNRFDKESGSAMIQRFNHLQNEAIRFNKEGVPPDGEKGQKFAEEYWKMIMEFTRGDRKILAALMEMGKFNETDTDDAWRQQQMRAGAFVGPALDAYFTKLGQDPFQEAQK